MTTKEKPISIAEAISPVPPVSSAETDAWHLDKLKSRHAAADAGRFASSEAVKTVIRKFVPNG